MDRLSGVLCCLLLAAAPCLADTFSWSGNFSALGLDIQWDPYLSTFSTTAPSDVTIRSLGYAAGGFVPILSVFDGTGPTAVFRALDDGSGGFTDPLLALPNLPAGDYTLALTAYANYPWAYHAPACCTTLGDGFIGLGILFGTTDYFSVELTTAPVGTIPEPASVLLLAACGAALAVRRYARRAV